MSENENRVIHAAVLHNRGGVRHYLLLRKNDASYQWFKDTGNGEEEPTPISAKTPQEAIRLASRHWGYEDFHTLFCGFRFTLPERDEVGCNALFHQMASSYSSMNGVYFDEDCRHQCVVNGASKESLALWKQLQSENRL